MKKRVGTLNNIPIVEGDPNLVTNKELLHKGGGQLSKRNIEGKIEDLGNGNGSSSCEEEYYFLITTVNSKLQSIANAVVTQSISGSFKLDYPNVGTIYSTPTIGMSGNNEILGFSISRTVIMPELFKPIDSLDYFALMSIDSFPSKTKEEILQIVDNYKKEVLQFQVTKEEYYENNFINIEELLTIMGYK